jgi:hypothetical protein
LHFDFFLAGSRILKHLSKMNENPSSLLLSGNKFTYKR